VALVRFDANGLTQEVQRQSKRGGKP